MPTWRQALRTDRIPYGLVALETTQAHTKSLYVPKSMLDDAIPTSRPERPAPLRYWAHGGGGAKRRYMDETECVRPWALAAELGTHLLRTAFFQPLQPLSWPVLSFSHLRDASRIWPVPRSIRDQLLKEFLPGVPADGTQDGSRLCRASAFCCLRSVCTAEGLIGRQIPTRIHIDESLRRLHAQDRTSTCR